MTSLLVEFQTEELPPKALKKLSAAFAEGVFHGPVSYTHLTLPTT